MIGRLTLVGTAGEWRYLRSEIDCRQSRSDQIASLGHELQHAIEIAEAPLRVPNHGRIVRHDLQIGADQRSQVSPNIVHEIGDVILRLNREAGVTVLLVEQKV